MANESKIVLSNKQNGTTTEIIDNNISSASKKFYLPNTSGKLLTLSEADSKYLSVKDKAVTITVGPGGNFLQLNDALEYCKQNISKKINAVTKIKLLADFNGDLFIQGDFPYVLIDCNGYKLANKLVLAYVNLIIKNLKIDKGLNAVFSNLHLYGGVTAGYTEDEEHFGFGAPIFANSSNIVIGSGDVNLTSKNFGLHSKGASTIYMVYPATYTQTTGTCFARVISGGVICSDSGINLDGVTVTKTNIAANTLTLSGIITGSVWEGKK